MTGSILTVCHCILYYSPMCVNSTQIVSFLEQTTNILGKETQTQLREPNA